uniref:Desmocollin-2-like n=1 Tax=Stegastes partitus TaxID=144197 RepID=A0A3B4ZHU3_9TELE
MYALNYLPPPRLHLLSVLTFKTFFFRFLPVDVSDCAEFITSDPDFTVTAHGEIKAAAQVAVTAAGLTFSVWARERNGSTSEMKVHLVLDTLEESHVRRLKCSFYIVSDSDIKHNVYYTCSGPGVNEFPAGVFSLHRETGMLTVHKAVDREEFPVFDQHTRQPTDLPLPIEIKVDDVNDNAPQFSGPLQFVVQERCSKGTQVGQVIATDRDEPGSRHVLIKYALLTGLDLFTIDGATGVISTKFDYIMIDLHLVTVQIKDLGGDPHCLSSTATATIQLTDINDNPPTFTKSSYDVSVPENESEKLILRIPVEDKDLKNTPNWISKFVITKGNENGNFRIDTDPKTNDGLLYVVKPLDYEANKNVKLEITAKNQAELNGTDAQWMSIPVNVAVTDVDEGPQFSAPTVRFLVKENTPNGTVIGTYKAVDPETKSSEGIKYYKTSDPASWITVDKNTGELRVANTIDRESQFVKDGLYNITVKAVDANSKTGTGTVILQVEDVNDNVPELPTDDLVLCEVEGKLGSVVVNAVDKDNAPLSSPFSFALPPDNDGKWSVTNLNDTAGTLQQMKELPTGIYKVPMKVTDLQGFGRDQTVNVRICQCRNGVCLAKDRSVTLGGMGILALLLPLALLLLLRESPTTIILPTEQSRLHCVDNKTSHILSSHALSHGAVSPLPSSGLSPTPSNNTSSSADFVLQKLGYLGTAEDERFADDIVHSYRYEGAGSAAGSVGCCSDNGDTDNLDFLNTLGPKFKTLADVCRKS